MFLSSAAASFEFEEYLRRASVVEEGAPGMILRRKFAHMLRIPVSAEFTTALRLPRQVETLVQRFGLRIAEQFA